MHGLQFFRPDMQRAFRFDRRQNRGGIGQRPVTETLEGEPVETEKQIPHRVVQYPARLSIRQSRSRVKRQFFPQSRPAHPTTRSPGAAKPADDA